MAVDQSRKPDPHGYFEAEGLKLSRGKKWVTTGCAFHGGSDSMRINLHSGAFVCMAGCGARGGDVLAYHMAARGQGFIDSAKELGAWIDDGKDSARTRPTPLPARDALMVLAAESNLVAVAAANVAHGVVLSQIDLTRLLTAAGRIGRIAEVFA